MPAEFVQRGRSLVSQAQHQEAVRVCRLGLLANPGEIEGRLVLGSALMALGRFDEVLAEMRQTLDMDPHNAAALALKGEALLRKGDLGSARQAVGHASAVAPADDHIARLVRAVEGGSNTIDIDPEIEGVEIHGSQVVAFDPPSAVEISSADLELVEETTGASRDSVHGFDRGVDADAEGPTGYYNGNRQVAAPLPRSHASSLPPEGYGGPPVASQSGVIRAPEPPPTIGDLFPDEEPGVSTLEIVDPDGGPSRPFEKRAPPVDPYGRTIRVPPDLGGDRERGPETLPLQSDDMRTIRAGVDRVSADERKRGRPRGDRETKRRGLPMWLYLVVAIAVIAGGVFAGFELRGMRLGRQIARAETEAVALARGDRLAGLLAARDVRARVAEVDDGPASRAELAAADARLAAEFGVHLREASRGVAAVAGQDGRTAHAARAYQALVEGDAAAARTAADALLEAGDERRGHYLLGRALLLSGEVEAAAAAFEKAVAVDPRPLTLVGLARAETARGRHTEALEALGLALGLADEHPTAVIWQARVMAASASVPDAATDPDARLAEIIAAGQGEGGAVSRSQAGWAALAAAEVKLARGDGVAARALLDTAKSLRPGADPAFSAGLAEVALALGDLDEARAEAKMAASKWPGAVPLLSARVALAGGDAAAARDRLAAAPESALESPIGLATRGAVSLALGEVDDAARDLDAALEARPDLRPAVIARARIDLARGDARAALDRLEPLHDDRAGADLTMAYAAALRASGAVVEARKVLAPLVDGDDASPVALLALAELERASGRFKKAEAAYDRALSIAPNSIDARLGATRLALDDGRLERAVELSDGLLADASDSVRVLVEVARVRTLTGDAEAATELLDRAAKDDAGALSWMVARERGRALSRREKDIEAIAELERAISLESSDPETRLLLMEAHLGARNKRGARRSLQDITKTFQDHPVRLLAAGIQAMVTERAGDALKSFEEARVALDEAKASKRERAEAWYWLGRAQELGGKLDPAAKALARAADLDPTRADASYWLGQIQFQQGKLAEMTASYERSVAADAGANPLAWFFLGQEYARVENSAKAIAALKAFLEHWPDESGDVVAEARALLAQLEK